MSKARGEKLDRTNKAETGEGSSKSRRKERGRRSSNNQLCEFSTLSAFSLSIQVDSFYMVADSICKRMILLALQHVGNLEHQSKGRNSALDASI
ncbi:hypothetical protein RJ641_019756 [Dillenia turbinata]|uniref:Uncharacterized protein n=1 Tax=Dillenia turbinata TaxID=194707 RepID=A0AAN8YTH6_9MAGN